MALGVTSLLTPVHELPAFIESHGEGWSSHFDIWIITELGTQIVRNDHGTEVEGIADPHDSCVFEAGFAEVFGQEFEALAIGGEVGRDTDESE